MDQFKELESLGYIGIFFISLLASATIIFPAPGWIVVIISGAFFDPVLVALVAGTGAAFGELTGYLAGDGMGKLFRIASYENHKKWIKKYDVLAITFFSFIPNPLFDIAGMAAGAVGMPVWRFLISCAVGKIGKYLLLAYFGSLFGFLL